MTTTTSYPTKKVTTALILGFSLALIAALTVDQSLSLEFKSPELEELWLGARSITNVGLSQHYFIIVIFLYFFCRFAKPQWLELRAWARDSFFALIVSGVFVHIFKFCVGRQRPHISPDFNPYVFHPFTMDWNYHSFVSGHSQVMFTVATMLSLGLPKGKWFFFALAVFFSLTRVIIHDHFLSDVFGGATMGYVGSLTAVSWTHRWVHRAKK